MIRKRPPKANNVEHDTIHALLHKYPGGSREVIARAIRVIDGCFRKVDPLCDHLPVRADRHFTERLIWTKSYFKRRVVERYCTIYPSVWKARLAADIYQEWARKQVDFGHRKDIDPLTIWSDIERWVYWGKGKDPWESRK